MDVEFDVILKAYTELENEVRDYISELFGETCALCTSSCCTPDICEESLDSSFLKLVRSRYEPNSRFCDRYGWLTERGCTLKYGRPPVCYGFFCNEIVDSLSDKQSEVIRILGRLLSWVGEKALGAQHLVEIMESTDLNRLNLDRIIKRINVANVALAGVKKSLQELTPEGEQIAAMRQISSSYVNHSG